ncbi:MAG: flagellar motor protein MotB [Eubacteriales bacterium]
MAKELPEEEAADWMGTYGDMVTLLLCFFVLMYAMSSVDEEKWNLIVKAFNSDASTLIEEVVATDSDETDPDGGDSDLIPELTEEIIDIALEMLYVALQAAASDSSSTESTIAVTKGDGFVFVSFNDAIFFDGDSAVLRDDGKAILDTIVGPLDEAAPYIDEIHISGHTAQASATDANNVQVDRTLSSDRATNVLVYVQQNTTWLDPARLASVGRGQWLPIDSNTTSEGRANNRRVEMMITGLEVDSALGDSIDQYYMVHDLG